MPRGRAAEKPKGPQGRPSIFTAEQLEFLISRLKDYLAAAGKRLAKGDTFWATVFPYFFGKWPVSDPPVNYDECTSDDEREKLLEKAREDAQKSMRDKIKAWFYRQTQKQNEKATWSKYIMNAIRPKKGAPRRWGEGSMYKFYMSMDEHKPKVDDEAYEELDGRSLSREEVLTHWCGVAQRLWDKEPEDVRKAVREAAEASYLERKAEHEGDLNAECMTEETRTRARANMVGALQPWMEEITRIVGGQTASFFVGLAPTEETPWVRTLAVHTGYTTVAKGSKKFDQHDPPQYQGCLRTFGRFTEDTIDNFPGQAPVQDNSAIEGPPFRGMISFQEEQENGSGSDALGTPAGNLSDAMEGVEPTASSANATSMTAAIAAATEQVRARIAANAPAAPSPSSNTPAAPSPSVNAEMQSRSDVESAPSNAPAAPAAKRPTAKAIRYDAPQVFDSYIVKGVKLSNAFRALLQRMPKSERDSRLSTMARWDAPTFTKANKMAEENAALPLSSTRDNSVLTEIFKNWLGSDKPLTSRQPDQPKRKRSENDEDDYCGSDEESGGVSEPERPRRRSTRSAAKRAAVAGSQGAGEGASDAPQSKRRRTMVATREQPEADQPPHATPAPSPHAAPAPSPHATPAPTPHATPAPSPHATPAPSPHVGPAASPQASPPPHASPPPSRQPSAAPPPHSTTPSPHPTLTIPSLNSSLAPKEGAPSARPPHQSSAPPRDSPAPPRTSSQTPRAPSPVGDPARNPFDISPPSSPGRPSTTERLSSVDRQPEHVDQEIAPSEKTPAPPGPSNRNHNNSNDDDVAMGAWMVNCLDCVKDLEGAAERADERATYASVIELWIALEKENGYKDTGKNLPAGPSRPHFVSEWIKRARSASYLPDLSKPKEAGETDAQATYINWTRFRENLATWWHRVNPDWRTQTAQRFALGGGDGDLSSLYCTGQNGLISIIVCLKWWWELFEDPLVEESEGDREAWHLAAQDVVWTLRELLKQIRTNGIPDTSSARRPAKRRKTQRAR